MEDVQGVPAEPESEPAIEATDLPTTSDDVEPVHDEVEMETTDELEADVEDQSETPETAGLRKALRAEREAHRSLKRQVGGLKQEIAKLNSEILERDTIELFIHWEVTDPKKHELVKKFNTLDERTELIKAFSPKSNVASPFCRPENPPKRGFSGEISNVPVRGFSKTRSRY